MHLMNSTFHNMTKHNNATYETMTNKYEHKSSTYKISGHQNSITKQSCSQKPATQANYVVAYDTAKKFNALSDGKFIKNSYVPRK